MSSTRSQVSGHTANGPSPPTSPKASPKKPEAPSPASGSAPPPRSRVLSLLSRVDPVPSVPSPLAQLFQPLNVTDDAQIESDQQLGAAGAAAPTSNIVSYGPATRRRLSSIHPQPVRRAGTVATTATGDSFLPQGQTQGQQGQKRFPAVSSPVARAGISSLAAQPLSESPGDESSGPTETAGQLEDEGSNGMFEHKLAAIEERQKRIEDLLIHLTANLPRR